MILIKNNKFLNSKIENILKKFYVTQHLKIEIIQSFLFLCVEMGALNRKLFFSTKLYLNFIYKLEKGPLIKIQFLQSGGIFCL